MTSAPPTGRFRRLAGSLASFVCGLSLLLCLLVCLAWSRSYRAGWKAASFPGPDRRYEASSADGVLTVTRIDGLPPAYVNQYGRGDLNSTATRSTSALGVRVTRAPYDMLFVYPLTNYQFMGGSAALQSLPGDNTYLYPPYGGNTGGSQQILTPPPAPTAVQVTVPWRVPAAALALPPAAWAAGWLWRAARGLRRRRRARAGRCADCGYDLRGSPNRCPECGRPPALAARAA